MTEKRKLVDNSGRRKTREFYKMECAVSGLKPKTPKKALPYIFLHFTNLFEGIVRTIVFSYFRFVCVKNGVIMGKISINKRYI